jgi:excisionase family DNA binding protein
MRRKRSHDIATLAGTQAICRSLAIGYKRPAEMEIQKLSIKAAAAQLGIAPVTLRSWLRHRRLPFYKVGPRRIVLDREDVARFLAANRVSAESASPNSIGAQTEQAPGDEVVSACVTPMPWTLRAAARYLAELGGDIEMARAALDILEARP